MSVEEYHRNLLELGKSGSNFPTVSSPTEEDRRRKEEQEEAKRRTEEEKNRRDEMEKRRQEEKERRRKEDEKWYEEEARRTEEETIKREQDRKNYEDEIKRKEEAAWKEYQDELKRREEERKKEDEKRKKLEARHRKEEEARIKEYEDEIRRYEEDLRRREEESRRQFSTSNRDTEHHNTSNNGDSDFNSDMDFSNVNSTNTDVPDLCIEGLDAVASITGDLFMFKGQVRSMKYTYISIDIINLIDMLMSLCIEKYFSLIILDILSSINTIVNCKQSNTNAIDACAVHVAFCESRCAQGRVSCPTICFVPCSTILAEQDRRSLPAQE